MPNGYFTYAAMYSNYNIFRREVLYNICIEFGTPVKLVRLIKMFKQNL